MNFAQFSRLISEIAHVPLERIHEDSSFREDLGIDSLQMVNLYTHCFEAFKVGIEVISNPDDLRTVGRLYRAMTRGGN